MIDSQMVLAGNLSLIDPTRAQTAPETPDGPLVLEQRPMQRVPGATGEDLERLHQTYFAVDRIAPMAVAGVVPADLRPRNEEAAMSSSPEWPKF